MEAEAEAEEEQEEQEEEKKSASAVVVVVVVEVVVLWRRCYILLLCCMVIAINMLIDCLLIPLSCSCTGCRPLISQDATGLGQVRSGQLRRRSGRSSLGIKG